MPAYKDVLDTLTLIVIAIGLYFAYDQAVKIKESIEVNNRNISATAWSNISTATIDVDKVFIENPGMQKYFYDDVDIKDGEQDYSKAYAIGILVLDYFDYVAAFSESYVGKLPSTLLEVDAWRNYMGTTFKSSPLLCRIYRAGAPGYGSSIRKVAVPACADSPGAKPPGGDAAPKP